MDSIYTAGLKPNLQDTGTGVWTPYAATGNNSPVCVAYATIAAAGATSTITINRGTWDGISTFTSTERIAYATAIANTTATIPVLYVTGKDEALQVIVAGASAKAHFGTQGMVVKVA